MTWDGNETEEIYIICMSSYIDFRLEGLERNLNRASGTLISAATASSLNENVNALLAEAREIRSPREQCKFGTVCAILTSISTVHPSLV